MSFDTERPPGARQVAGPEAMRALAHPVRLELLEQLATAGTLTAAQAARLVGGTPANCSFHFRTLHRYGFVEPAPAPRGHVRPWRRVPGGIGTAEVHEDPEASASARALTDLIVGRNLGKIREYRAIGQDRIPAEWRELGGHLSLATSLSLEQLRELRAELLAVLARYTAPDPADRPPSARAVQLFAFVMPGEPAAENAPAADEHEDDEAQR